MGLVMQYPEQVLGENPDANQRAYGEMLNNVKTKLIGNIKSDDDLSESLFHEDLDAEEIKTRIAGLRQGEWVCELPPTGFQEEKAEILTVDALPIPPGHSESPFDIPAHSEKVREESREKYCIRDGYSTDTHQADRDAAPDTDEQTDGDTDESDATDHSGLKAYDDVANEDLSHKKTFLSMAGSMFTDGVNGHTLAESMTNMPMSHHADELDEAGLLERHEMGNNQVYYVPTEEALELDNVSMRPEGGGELGDESFEHRFGARIAATWLEQRDYEEVRMYHTPQREAGGDSRDNKFDVFALPGKETDSDRRKIVEVETSTEKKGHVTDDYEDIADAYGDGIWIVESFEDARELIGHLVDGGYIDDNIDQGVRSFEDLNDQLDYEGISRVLSITDLMDRIE
jgi:hypothetical protein